jgi:hypothetical protein
MGLTIALFWLLAAGIVLMVLYQGLTRSVDLFSIRNIYLAGFIVYQIVSPVMALQSDFYAGFRIVDPAKAGKWMLIFNYVFVAIFLLSYHRIKLVQWLAAKFPQRSATASDSMLTGLAFALILFAVVLRLVGVRIPILQSLSVNVSVALAATSCAIIGWVWAQRRLNPAVLSIAFFIISVSMVVSLTGFYSRRPLVSILAGFSWGAYHRWARFLPPGKLLLSAAPLAILAGLVVAAFTAIRSHSTGVTDAQVTLQQMKSASISKGTSDLLSGQAVGPAALWMVEKFPREVRYEHLFTFRYMAYWFVPRMLWEDKPEPLSTKVAHLAKLRGVNRDAITIPPGVVGYAAAEGGFYALVLYALFFGQFTRFFDELITLNPHNPFIILPVGCATGQFLGLARGEIAIFTNLAIVGFALTFLLIYLTSLAFGQSQNDSLRAPATPYR